MPVNFLLFVAACLTAAAWWLIYNLEDETEFPCIRDKEQDEWYEKRREGLKK